MNLQIHIFVWFVVMWSCIATHDVLTFYVIVCNRDCPFIGAHGLQGVCPNRDERLPARGCPAECRGRRYHLILPTCRPLISEADPDICQHRQTPALVCTCAAFYAFWEAHKTGQASRVSQLYTQLQRLVTQAEELVVPNAFGSLLQRSGAVGLNATTSHDATKYFMSLPANKLELWFALEAERFQVHLMALPVTAASSASTSSFLKHRDCMMRLHVIPLNKSLLTMSQGEGTLDDTDW